MSLDVPNGAVLIVTVDLTLNSQGIFSSPNSVLAALQSDLAVDGFTLAQRSLGFSALLFSINGGEFSATLQILNGSGQDCDDTDIQASFNDAANEEGVTVNSWAPLQSIGGSTGVNTGTGAAGNVIATSGAGNVPGSATTPATTPSGVPQCGDPALTILKYPTQYISCLTNKGLTTVGLLAIGLLVGVVLIVFMQRRPTPI